MHVVSIFTYSWFARNPFRVTRNRVETLWAEQDRSSDQQNDVLKNYLLLTLALLFYENVYFNSYYYNVYNILAQADFSHLA